MKPELQSKLYKKYPKIFEQKDLPMTQTCMCWGVDCGDGWYWILDMLCGTIQSYCTNRNEGVRIKNKVKLKSKWWTGWIASGRMRFLKPSHSEPVAQEDIISTIARLTTTVEDMIRAITMTSFFGWRRLFRNIFQSFKNLLRKFKERNVKEYEWQVEATQVKEKYGGLRFYINGGDDEVYGMISLAEHMSYNTCEYCGDTKTAKVRGTGWIFTLCDKCAKEKRLMEVLKNVKQKG